VLVDLLGDCLKRGNILTASNAFRRARSSSSSKVSQASRSFPCLASNFRKSSVSSSRNAADPTSSLTSSASPIDDDSFSLSLVPSITGVDRAARLVRPVKFASSIFFLFSYSAAASQVMAEIYHGTAFFPRRRRRNYNTIDYAAKFHMFDKSDRRVRTTPSR
jgi:hypothetical protein